LIPRSAIISLVAAALLAAGSAGAFSGYPYATNRIWADVSDLPGMLFTGTLERCEAMGVTPPEIVETWACSAGTSNEVLTPLIGYGFRPAIARGTYTETYEADVFTNEGGCELFGVGTNWYLWTLSDYDLLFYTSAGGPTSTAWVAYDSTDVGGVTFESTVTNVLLLTTNIVVTNQVGPFEYTVDGSNRMAYPSLTHGFVEALDDAIERIIDASVCTNYDDGGYDGWFTNLVYLFDTNGACTATNYMADFPMNTKAGLFDREGIGYVTNRAWYSFDPTTNRMDFVTGGDAYWTRQPPVTQNWLLAESAYTGETSWVFHDIGDFSKRFYDATEFPSLVYSSGGTNPLASPISVTVTGLVLVISNQATVATSETVTVSSINSTNQLTNQWYSIDGIAITNAGASTGDWISVTWLGDIALYADASYRLEVSDFDERVLALKACIYSRADATPSEKATYRGAGWGYAGVTSDWGTASVYGLDYPSAVADTDVEPTYTYPEGEIGTLNNDAGHPYDGWAWYYATHTGSRGPSKATYPRDLFWGHLYTNEVAWTHITNSGIANASHLGAAITLTNEASVTQRVEIAVPIVSGVAASAWGTYYAMDSGRAHYDLLSAQWLRAYDDRIRQSAVLSAIVHATNTACDIDLYLVGMYPGTYAYHGGAWPSIASDTNASTDWGGYSLIGSNFIGDYNDASPSDFVWAPEFGLTDLAPTGSYVFIESLFGVLTNQFAWTNAVSTNAPYAADTNYVQKGWAIRGAKILLRWDFEYR